MKKFLIMMALMLSLVLGASAQQAIETPKTLDNVYVTVQGGVSTPLNFNHVFPVNPQFGLAIGKQISPVFGVEAEGTTWLGSHVEIPVLDTYVTRFGQNENGNYNAFRGLYVGLNGTVNLTNLFLGYNGTPRGFELSAVAGTGWEHIFTPNEPDNGKNGMGVKTGLDFAFNLGKTKAHTISFKPAVLWNVVTFGEMPLQFNKNHAQLYLGLGYTYHFKTSNGTHAFKVYDVGAMNNEINRLQAELAKKPNVVVREIIREKIVNVAAENTVWIPFAFDKAELIDDTKAILNNLKDVKAVNVDGYASWEDGSNAEHNKALSIARAHTVTEYLKSIGVNVKNSEGHGAEGITSQRCVIVSVVK